MQRPPVPEHDKITMHETIDTLIQYIDAQRNRMSEKRLARGVADKDLLFGQIKIELERLKGVLELNKEVLDNKHPYQDQIKEAIIRTAIVAHHRRFSKTNTIATGLGYVISAGYWKPAAESESWTAWKNLKDKFELIQAEQNDRVKNNFSGEYYRTVHEFRHLIAGGANIDSYNDYRKIFKP